MKNLRGKRLDFEITDKLLDRFWSKVNKKGEDDCWKWRGAEAQGYGQFNISGKIYKTHRVSYYLITKVNLKELCVCHHCDNRKCCNPNHLFLGTHQDNMLDRDNKNRGVTFKGEEHGRAELTEAQVLEIRARYAKGGYTHRGLAEEYNLVHSQIGFIIRHQSWKHI